MRLESVKQISKGWHRHRTSKVKIAMTKTPASLRSDPGALLHNGGRFVSESLADFSGIRTFEIHPTSVYEMSKVKMRP